MTQLKERMEQLERRSRRPLGPGEIAAGILEELEISPAEFARRIDVAHATVELVLDGQGAITPDLAHRFGRFFGNGPTIWMNLQQKVELWDTLHLDASRYQTIEAVQERLAA